MRIILDTDFINLSLCRTKVARLILFDHSKFKEKHSIHLRPTERNRVYQVFILVQKISRIWRGKKEE